MNTPAPITLTTDAPVRASGLLPGEAPCIVAQYGILPERPAADHRPTTAPACTRSLPSASPEQADQGTNGVVADAAFGKSTDTKRRVKRRRDFTWFVQRYELPRDRVHAGRRKDLDVIADMHRMGTDLATRFPASLGIDPDNVVGNVLELAFQAKWLNRFKVRRKTKLRAFTRATIANMMMALARKKSHLPLFSGSVEHSPVAASPGDLAAAQEQTKLIEAAVGSLTRRDRRLLGLLQSRRPSNQQRKVVALGNQSTQNVRRHRLRAALGRQLGVDPSHFTRHKGRRSQKRTGPPNQ